MLPFKAKSLEELAVLDPVAAYALLRGLQPKPVCLNAYASFSSFSVTQQPITQPLDQTITRRTWITDVEFDLQLPNAYVGSIFLPQALAQLKQSPGVSVQITVMSGPRYLVSDTFTPIDSFCSTYKSQWASGWQVEKFQQIQTKFLLTQVPFNDASNAPPYIVTLTFNAFQFDSPDCDEVSYEYARNELVRVGCLKRVCAEGFPPLYCAGGSSGLGK